MYITDIKAFPVWVGTRNQMLVKVETNEGIYLKNLLYLFERDVAIKTLQAG